MIALVLESFSTLAESPTPAASSVRSCRGVKCTVDDYEEKLIVPDSLPCREANQPRHS